MPDNWFCESCGSLNRGNANRCYRCKSPQAQAIAATTRDQRPQDALLPGADKVDAARVAAQLAPHPYTDPSLLGYLSVLGFTVLIAAGLATIAGSVAALLAMVAPDTFQFTDAMRRLTVVAGAVAAAGSILALLCHSVFLWLTTRNVPALAGGTPRFGSGRALAWWLEAYLWQLWAFCIVWVVPAILLVLILFLVRIGMATLGAIGFFVALAAIWYFGRYTGIRIDFPQYALEVLRKPARLLEDVTERLAVKDSPGRRLVSLWSTSWVVGAVIRFFLPYLVLGLWVFIVLLFAVRALAGVGGRMPSQSDLLLTQATFVALMGLTALLADLLAVFFMARVTLALTDAQRERRRWLVEGESLLPNQLAQAPRPAQAAVEPNTLATPASSASLAPIPRPAGAFTGFDRGAVSAAASSPAPEPSVPRPEVDPPSRRPDMPPG